MKTSNLSERRPLSTARYTARPGMALAWVLSAVVGVGHDAVCTPRRRSSLPSSGNCAIKATAGAETGRFAVTRHSPSQTGSFE